MMSLAVGTEQLSAELEVNNVNTNMNTANIRMNNYSFYSYSRKRIWIWAIFVFIYSFRSPSHDTPAVVAQKAQYIADVGLGGVIYWESSGDRGIGAGSLMETFINAVGGVGHLESSLNHLNYPNSKYDNVRNGFSREE